MPLRPAAVLVDVGPRLRLLRGLAEMEVGTVVVPVLAEAEAEAVPLLHAVLAVVAWKIVVAPHHLARPRVQGRVRGRHRDAELLAGTTLLLEIAIARHLEELAHPWMTATRGLRRLRLGMDLVVVARTALGATLDRHPENAGTQTSPRRGGIGGMRGPLLLIDIDGIGGKSRTGLCCS